MNLRKTLTSSILAGIFISLGASASLAAPDKVIGAFLFTLGLTAILVFKVDLFTGKCGYLVTQKNKKEYLKYLAVVWIGNLLGCACIAAVVGQTLTANTFLSNYQDKVFTLIEHKGIGTVATSILCGMLMYIAVDGYKRCEKDRQLTGCVCYILSVMVFILCGFEHCIADMFYFILAGSFHWSTLVFLVCVTLGNLIGGSIIHLLITYSEKQN